MSDAFIRSVKLVNVDYTRYPFSIPAIKSLESVKFTFPVTFLVGENGSGKSTIVESIAVAAGFSAEGGTKNYNFKTLDTTSDLKDELILVRGTIREKYGYFLRAESFYTAANYAENGTFGEYGPIPILFDGKHIHEQSHGEAFLSIVKEFRPGLFLFDEPESALSPQRQLTLLAKIHDLVKQGSQFIIATHSPILLSYPNAIIYELSSEGIEQTKYEDVGHVKLTKDFLNNSSRYLQALLT